MWFVRFGINGHRFRCKSCIRYSLVRIQAILEDSGNGSSSPVYSVVHFTVYGHLLNLTHISPCLITEGEIDNPQGDLEDV